MILSELEIIDIIKNPRNSRTVKVAQQTQKEHDRHVSGCGFKSLVKPLEGFEHEDQLKVKEQLAQPATIPIVSELRQSLSKWQSATDTHKSYVFEDKEKEVDFKKDVLSKVWKLQSIDYFVNTFLKNGLWNKFNDFLIVNRAYIVEKEIDGKIVKIEIIDGVEKIYEGGDLSLYIAHIPIDVVHDFCIFGNKVEYLAYQFDEKDSIEYYKVLDDRAIYTVTYNKLKSDNERITILGNPIPTELQELTAIRLSSLLSIINNNSATSLLEPAISYLNAYVDDYAIYRVSKIIHAFPKGWAIGAKCTFQDEKRESTVCTNGKIDIKSGDEFKTITCPKCLGTGWNTVRDASQTFIIPMMLEGEEKPFTSTPIGYASQPIDSLVFLREDLEKNEVSIKDKILTKNSLLEKSIQKTATEVIENQEPVVILNMFFASLIEFTEKKLTDWIGRMYSNQYERSNINYGLNYANKNKDQITDEIKKSVESGISISEVFDLHKKRIRAANNKDNQKMLWQMILVDIEPFPTMTIEQVENSQSILPIDKMKKFYFLEYIDNIDIDISSFTDTENYKKQIKRIKEQINTLNKNKYENSPTKDESNGKTLAMSNTSK